MVPSDVGERRRDPIHFVIRRRVDLAVVCGARRGFFLQDAKGCSYELLFFRRFGFFWSFGVVFVVRVFWSFDVGVSWILVVAFVVVDF